METQFGVLSKAIEVMGLQSAAALAALLAGVVVALVYRFAPRGSFPRLALTFSGKRSAILPVRCFVGVGSHVSVPAWLATKCMFADSPRERSFKFLLAILANKNTNAASPRVIARSSIRGKEAPARAVFAAALANFAWNSLKRVAAYLAGALYFVFFGFRVTGVGTVLTLCAGGVVEGLAAIRANSLNSFHVTLLAQGVGLFGAGQFVAKNEGSETLIRHYLAPQIHYTTGGA